MEKPPPARVRVIRKKSVRRTRDKILTARRRGQPYRSSVTGEPREVKRYFIAQFLPSSTGADVYPMRALQLAAVEIQRMVRGRGLRRRFAALSWCSVRQKAANVGEDPRAACMRVALGAARPLPVVEPRWPHGGYTKRRPSSKRSSRSPMLDKYLACLSGHEVQGTPAPAYASGGFAVWSAARLQAWWRMLKARRFVDWRCFRMYHIASQQIQFLWKTFQQEMYIHLEGSKAGTPYIQQRRSPEEDAAIKVQHLWRQYTNVRIFQYYRELIQFRLTGDPAALLRTINPREASLFDKATGIHVRFRLGGQTFPPTMFYKVFLLNPLCDLGAFAPRDYADTKQADAHQLNLNQRAERGKPGIGGPLPLHLMEQSSSDEALAGSRLYKVGVASTRLGQIRVGGSYFGTKIEGLGPNGTSNWYQRVENNEWRPITQRVLGESLAPEVEAPPGAMSAAEKASFGGGIAFHYSRMKRREDTVAKRKAKKRAWLMRMYQEGLATEREPGGGGGGDGSGVDQRRAFRKRTEGVEMGNFGYGRGSFDESGDEEKLDRILTGVGSSRPKVLTMQNSRILRALDQPDGDGDNCLGDVEGLLQWSNELDYDSYIANWHVLATSATSGSDFHEPVNGKGRRYYTGATMGPLRTGDDDSSQLGGVLEPDWFQMNPNL